MRILVTGALGFLGSEITRHFVAAGFHVRTTDITSSPFTSAMEYYPADILKPDNLVVLFKGMGCVVHAAGLAHIFSQDSYSDNLQQINELGTANVASAAAMAGVAHLILISSVSVYGTYTQGMYDENTPCKPVGPYARSKYNAELRAIEIARDSGIALTVLRLATLYGEGDPGNVSRLIRSLDKGRFFWIGDGKNKKSLLYKGDAARACMAVAERPASGVNIYNVSAPACTMCEIVAGITDALGENPFHLKVPASLALLLSRYLSRIPNRHMAELHPTVKKWLAEDIYNTHRFEDAYGFQTMTSLKDGLKREVDWYTKKVKSAE